MARKKQSAQAIAAAQEQAGLRLLDEWLRIENEHTDPGFILPGRAEIVSWIEDHAQGSLLAAGAVVLMPVLGALSFG